MESLPTNVDNCAGIGLEKDDVTIDFSVWEQTIFEVDYGVVGPLGEEVQSEYFSPAKPEEIEPVLDDIVRKLIEGSYIPTRRQ
jgi:hypothetical protein